MFYKTVPERALLPDYTAEALAGEWVPISTAAGGFFTTRLYERGHFLPDYAAAEVRRGEASNLVGRKWRASAPFFNYQTARGEAKQNSDACCRFASYSTQVTRSSYSVERAMEVLLQDCTGARMLPNCTATFFLFSTTRLHGGEQPTNPMLTTAAAAFFSPNRKQIFLNIIIIHLLHSHIHCDLDHSCSILPLHDLHFFSRTERKFPSIEGFFFPSTLLATQLIFKSPAGGEEFT